MGTRERAPYMRIADELRQRIERGELARGERVPSTREIAREWGVAMATATKVLAALRRAGLVRAVPGVGTVVDRPVPRAAPAPARRRPASGPAMISTGLTRERVVAAAVAIADAEGIDGVSMRRVATELGTAPTSLYRHVSDKDDLLLHMMDAALREWRVPADTDGGWRACLEYAGRTLWSLFRRHTWLAAALSLTRPQPIAAGMAYTEWVLTALEDSGLDLAGRFDVHLTLFSYARGTAVNLESEAAAEAATGLDNDGWMRTQEATLHAIVAQGPFPQFEQLMAADFDLDVDGMFERGLGYLLDGVELALDRR